VKEHEPYSNPRPKKKAEVHGKTSKKAKVWRVVKKYVKQGSNLNESNMC